MPLFKKISIQRKQTLIIMLISGMALLLACISIVTYDVMTFRRTMVSNLSTLAEIIGNNSSAALDFDDPKSAAETLSALRAEPNIETGCIYTKDGEVFAVYDRADNEKEILPPPPQQNGHHFEDNTLHLFRQIVHDNEVIGTVYVESDLNALYARLGRYALIVLGVFFAASLLALLLSNRLQKIVSGPILHLVQMTRSVAREKNFSTRAVKWSEDELGTLVDSFNEMLSEIQSRDIELQKSKDALEERVRERTHELAGSLSLLRATLESTADGILVADGQGKVSSFNEHFVRMWQIPRELADAGDEQRMLEVAVAQLKYPEKFIAKINDLYGRPELESFDLVEFKDGRIFERYSKPQQIGKKFVGRVWSFRDITGRKRAESILQRTEELYRRAIAGAEAVPYSYDYETRSYLFIGEGIEQLIGYKPEEMKVELWRQLVQESIMLGDTAGFEKDDAARRVAAGEIRQWRCDMRVTTRDGKSRWISDTSVQNLDESGKPTGALGILQDITERKQTELRITAFMNVGQKLSAAKSAKEAGEIIIELADQLFGWDSCMLNLCSADNQMSEVLNKDTINGRRTDCSIDCGPTEMTPRQRKTMQNGPQLVLKNFSTSEADGVSFGDTARRSASAMHVPVRDGSNVIGVLSIFSYTPNAYTEEDLPSLQSLADHCGGALNRIQADEALRRTEELYRRAIAGADAVPYSYDYKTKSYVFIGAGIEQLIGYAPEKVSGKLWKDIIQESVMSGETAGLGKEEAAQKVQSGELLHWRCDMRVITRDGKSRWISDAAVQNLDENGRAIGSMGILQDITERKQAEISAMAFSKLGQNLSSAASPREAARIISEVSDDLIGWDACSLQLYSEDEDTVYSIFEIDTTGGKRVDTTLSETRKATELHHRILNAGGELILRDGSVPPLAGTIGFGNKLRRSASILYVPIRYRSRRVGILSVHSYTANAYDEQDLRTLQTLADQCGGTLERIRADDAFRKSESQFRLVWDTSSDGMRLSDEKGIVVMANDAYCRMVGKSKAEIENHPLSIIHSAENAEFIQTKHCEEIAARSFLPHLEKEIKLWNGKKIWFELSNSILELPEQPTMLLSVFRDITYRKEADEALRQTEALYRRAIGGAGAVPYACDYLTKNYLFMGEQIEALIGYAPHEITGGLWKQIIQESIMVGDAAGLNKTEAGNQVLAGKLQQWRCDMRVITKDGKSRWLSDTSVQTLDETGRVIGSMGILQDITERKQAEISALAFSKLGKNLSSAASPEHAARIISEVAEDLLSWDACYVQMCSETNDRIHSLFDADTVDGKRIMGSLSQPQKLSSLHERILKSGAELILRDNPNTFLQGGIPFGNKSRPSVSLMYVPIRSGNRSVGILSIQSYKTNAYDDHDLKTLQTLADQCGGAMQRIRAGEAMRKSESQFRLVWDTSADGMRLANRDGTVLLANDAYCRMVDKSRAEIEGESLSIIHQEQNIEKILRKHQEQIDSRTAQTHLEKEVTLWNGKKIWLELSNSLLELPGQPMLMLSIFRDITQRKQSETELEAMHRQLLDTSRQAGMAEVATSVLHNVGNVLNSVNVSGSLIREKIKKSRVTNLNKIAAIFQEHDGGLPEFFSNDPKGKQLPGYLSQLAAHLGKEQQEVLQEIGSLVNNIEHIKEIVAMQQSYSKVSGMSESLQVIDLVEDALRMNAGALDRHQVQVIREYSQAPQILVEKHKVLQILINLIRNAKYACDEAQRTDKHIRVRVTNDQSHLSIAIIDNGIGIPAENLTRIFNHGFTTRKDGHGFGLHSGALAAIEIGGSLNAHSDGVGKGAEFTLKLPVNV